MKLLSLWHWWNVALLLAHIIVASLAVLYLAKNEKLRSLYLLRVFLSYWAIGGILQFLAAAITPLGSLFYWHVTVALSVGSDVLLFLLCAQIVDNLIRRDDVRRVKKVWLLGLPLAFVVAVILNRLEPSACIAGLFTFGTLAAAVSGLALIASYITPPEDWLSGYGLVILGCALEILSPALARLTEVIFHCPAVDVVYPLATLITLVVFLWAAMPPQRIEVQSWQSVTECF